MRLGFAILKGEFKEGKITDFTGLFYVKDAVKLVATSDTDTKARVVGRHDIALDYAFFPKDFTIWGEPLKFFSDIIQKAEKFAVKGICQFDCVNHSGKGNCENAATETLRE